MGKFWGAFVFLSAALLGTSAVKVELFDSIGFQGPFLTATFNEGCFNLTHNRFLHQARSLKTDTCIILFKAEDCTSHSIRVDPGEYSDLTVVKHDTVNFLNPQSYRPCTAGEGGTAVNVDLHGHARTLDDSSPAHQGLLLAYRDVCSCINLPTKGSYIGNVTTVHNYGNCVKIWSNVNCTGSSVQLLGGVSPQSQDLSPLGSFIIPSTSIGLCEHRPTCHSLNVTTYKFSLTVDEKKVKAMSTASDIAMTAKTILRNNGSATQTQTYEAKKTIREVFEITRATTFTSSNTYSTVRSVKVESSVGFLWFKTKVTSTLTEAYTRTETTEDYNEDKYISDESREVVIRQQIEIPPCSVYEVDSYISMNQNYPVDYKVYSYVSATTKDGRLRAEEVKERLTDGLTFEEEYDEYTIIASGEGTIVADFAMEAVIDGEGGPLAGCQSGGDGAAPIPKSIRAVANNADAYDRPPLGLSAHY